MLRTGPCWSEKLLCSISFKIPDFSGNKRKGGKKKKGGERKMYLSKWSREVSRGQTSDDLAPFWQLRGLTAECHSAL